MKILFAASEAVPYCKTGGLADVAGALPVALSKKKQSVCLVLPLYKAIDRRKHKLKKSTIKLSVPLGNAIVSVQVWHAPPQVNLKTYFIGADSYFDREGLYGPVPGTDHPDNDKRYALFSRAVLELAKAVKFKPDVVHVHDWQTGLVPALLKTVYRYDPFFKNTASVFSIHNMAYQGLFERPSMAFTGLPSSEFAPNGIEFYGKVNFLKGGLAYADALSTVSPTYAQEICTKYEFGFGLEGLLHYRRDRLKGILNGLDVVAWDPKKDAHLISKFDVQHLHNRSLCKKDLQESAGLKVGFSIPVIGFVGRLDRQKGLTFILDIAPQILKEDVQFVFLGVGDREIQQKLLALQKNYKSKVFIDTDFSEPLAHKIYAGSDLFLMPSRFEPCGLGQMIAMRYGAFPVVTPTGGLLDTVKPYHHKAGGTGFMAKEISTPAVLDALLDGLREFKRTATWQAAQKRIMKIDFSWDSSIPAYLDHYEKARFWQKKASSR